VLVAEQLLHLAKVRSGALGPRTFAEAIEWASRARAATAAARHEQSHRVALVADEGGLAAPLPSNHAALDVVL